MSNRDTFLAVADKRVISYLLQQKNFEENAVLIDNPSMYSEYGVTSYLIRLEWLDIVLKTYLENN